MYTSSKLSNSSFQAANKNLVKFFLQAFVNTNYLPFLQNKLNS